MKKLFPIFIRKLPIIFTIIFGTVICTWFMSLYITIEGFDPNISIWSTALFCLIFQIASFKVLGIVLKSDNWKVKTVSFIAYFSVILLMIYFSDLMGMALGYLSSGTPEVNGSLSMIMRIDSLLDWFFEPGNNTDYFYSNFCIVLVASNTFAAVVLFYYTQIYFRISVVFLFTMIPAVLFAKDYREIPPSIIIICLALFFIITVHCRQMKSQMGIALVVNRSYAASVIAFLAFSLSFAILLPKPDIQNKRQDFEDFTTEYFSSSHGSAIDDFIGTSNENRGGSDNSDKELFQINASGRCDLLKAYSLQEYDPQRNLWVSSWADEFFEYTGMSTEDFEKWYPFITSRKVPRGYEYMSEDEIADILSPLIVQSMMNEFGYDSWSAHQELLEPIKLYNLMQRICSENPDFAKHLGLESLISLPYEQGEVATLSILYTRDSSLIPLPVGTFSSDVSTVVQHEDDGDISLMKSSSGRVAFLILSLPEFSPSRIVLSPDLNRSPLGLNLDLGLSSDTRISAKYYPKSVADNQSVNTLLTSLDTKRFSEILYDFLSYAQGEESEIIYAHMAELYLIDKMNNPNYFNPENADYRKMIPLDKNLDNYISADVQNLAQEITQGLYSDIEKATALENYFMNAGYKYSLDYSLSENRGIDDFIFNAKKGSCFHYATAMTLMARSVGLNARYCEGFSTGTGKNLLGNMYSYTVRSENSHAFCEVYIAGYGWMSFDPTVSAEPSRFALGSVQLAVFSLILVLFCTGLALLLVFIIIPYCGEKRLEIKVKKLSGEKSVRLIMMRLRKKHLKSSSSETTDQVCIIVKNKFECDISTLCSSFDEAVYGELPVSSKEALDAYEEYNVLLKAIKKAKKEQKKHNKISFFKKHNKTARQLNDS